MNPNGGAPAHDGSPQIIKRRWIPNLAMSALWLASTSAVITEYAAYRLHYHPLLGRPVFGHVYVPWAWFGWQYSFYNQARMTWAHCYFANIATVAVTFLGLALVQGRHRTARRQEGLHGTAHWAIETEIREAGLLTQPGKVSEGVYVGGWTDPEGTLRYLRHNGPEHIAAIAPTRSGKGVGLVVPTLLSWPHSCVVNDQKLELWNLTAGWRSKHAGNRCLLFNPAALEGSVSFNPLGEVRIGTLNEVGDVQNLATIMVDPDGKGLSDHWAKTAHALLTGVILHVLYAARARDGQSVAALPDVALALSDPARSIEELYAEMVANTHDGQGLYGADYQLKHPHQHPIVAASAADMLNRPDEERGSVLSTAASFLSLYRDPLIARNVRRSDFRISDLMNSEQPVTLYLAAREEDKDRLKPLMRLMINQLVRVLLRPQLQFVGGRPLQPHRHRLLLMLDEFPSYGKLEIFEEALAYIAGYGMKAYLIMQDVSQLWKIYGKEESITSNCHIRTAYAPNKLDTAEWLSKMTGKMTVQTEEFSESGKKFGAVLDGVSRNWKATERELLTADEAMRLKAPRKDESGRITEPGDLLVFVAGSAPIYGTQTLYFRDPAFLERARNPPPDCADSHSSRIGETDADQKATASPKNDVESIFKLSKSDESLQQETAS